MAFEKAIRERSKLRVALVGPSGSGKTYSALKIATGMGGKIALLDSEQGSSALYAKEFDFDVDTLSNKGPDEYADKIKEAVKAGYNVLVLDSITHEWDAVKESVDDITAKSTSNNSYAAWREPTQKHNRFVNAILQAPIHIICTMREKDEIQMTPNERGKLEPVKIGVKPDQRKGIEYEFTTIFNLVRKDHFASAGKDRTNLFDNFNDRITEQVGQAFKEWIEQGVETSSTRRASKERISFVFVLLKELKMSYASNAVKKRLQEITQKDSITYWTEDDVEAVVATLEKGIVKQAEDAREKSKQGDK